MKREIIAFGNYYDDFMKSLSVPERKKIHYIFDLLRVVLFNGFQKKTSEAPENEIKKALKIKEEYYGSK